jgi:exodeoxyribonuclease-3
MDFLLLSADATSKLIDAGVDAAFRGRDKPSDHAPTWIELTDR